jgi:hypothetical protein
MRAKLLSGVHLCVNPPQTEAIHERAHQYRVIAERLQFDLEREELLPKEIEWIRTAQQALATAADVVEKSASEPPRRLGSLVTSPRRAETERSPVLRSGRGFEY